MMAFGLVSHLLGSLSVKMLNIIKNYMRPLSNIEMANSELKESKSFKRLYIREGEADMKWNIFERLNVLERELSELREVVRYQGNTIIHLQLNDIEKEGQRLVAQETSAERINRQKREYYARNKAAITERRNVKKKFEEAKKRGDNKSAWYWKNVEQRRAYNRAYYKKKKLALQGNK